MPDTVTFIPGQTIGAQRCTVVSSRDDTSIEDEETFIITLVPSSSDGNSVRFTNGGSITVAIVQDPDDST